VDDARRLPPAVPTPDTRELLAAIVEGSDDAIVSKDLDGIITSWNRGAERVFGYTEAEAVGRSITMLIPEDMPDEEPAILARIRAGLRVDHYETKRRRKDGRIIDVSVTISPVRNEAGVIVGASKVARDITERKELEHRQARFLNMAAHELKTPLTPLALQVSLLRRSQDTLTPEQRQGLDVLDRNLGRLEQLVDDLLDATRLQAGKLKVRRTRLDLHAIVQDAVETFRPAAREAKVALDVRLGPPLVVDGDPPRLVQVLFNLLANAVKFTPEGGHIVVESAREGPDAVVRIRDDGIGIAPRDLDQLFQPFSQIAPAREPSRKSSGLGLYISKAIVEHHGGRIRAESRGRGQGATFTVTLPLATQDGAAAPVVGAELPWSAGGGVRDGL
jgi:PAS domain S-box-containing protein